MANSNAIQANCWFKIVRKFLSSQRTLVLSWDHQIKRGVPRLEQHLGNANPVRMYNQGQAQICTHHGSRDLGQRIWDNLDQDQSYGLGWRNRWPVSSHNKDAIQGLRTRYNGKFNSTILLDLLDHLQTPDPHCLIHVASCHHWSSNLHLCCRYLHLETLLPTPRPTPFAPPMPT
jgi:hypothetical protein